MSEVISIIMSGLMGYLTWYLKAQFSNKSATSKAMKIILRGQIYELHSRYVARGYIEPQELYEFTELVEVYKSFKGNGTAERMVKDVQALPLKEG